MASLEIEIDLHDIVARSIESAIQTAKAELNDYALEKATTLTMQLIEKAPIGELPPVDIARYCITAYFAHLPPK